MTRIRFDGCDLSPGRGTPVCQSYHRRVASQLLRDVWPEVADGLRLALASENQPKLAESVDSLHFLRVCPCGDDFCRSVHTGEGDVVESITFMSGRLFAADLDSTRQIVYVEILHRDDLKPRFRELAS